MSLVTEAVDRVEGNEIVDASGARHEVDVILLATGFEPGKLLESMHVTGRQGRQLSQQWANDDPRAHLGITVPGFPNLFVMTGPNTGLAHGGSLMLIAEVQVRYVTTLMRDMLEQGLAEVEVKQPVHDAYNARVDAEHAQLVWSHGGMRNWYRNAQGRVFAVMPWRMVDYWTMTRTPDLSEFETRGAAQPA
ncbi:MAG: hypothetical protein NTV17_12180 [Burkholderiales bacterium]|nr:hypothetical protein [Burkholderiales bacterium]